MKNIITALLLTFIFMLQSSCFAELKIGEKPPNYLGKNADGEKIYLENYTGKIVIVTFWATWCGPCMEELPILENIQKKVGKEHIQVIAINYKESKKKFARIADLLKESPVLVTYDHRSKISKRYGIKSIPHMFIIDRKGILFTTHNGYGSDMLPKIVAEVNEVLNKI